MGISTGNLVYLFVVFITFPHKSPLKQSRCMQFFSEVNAPGKSSWNVYIPFFLASLLSYAGPTPWAMGRGRRTHIIESNLFQSTLVSWNISWRKFSFSWCPSWRVKKTETHGITELLLWMFPRKPYQKGLSVLFLPNPPACSLFEVLMSS